MARMIPSFADSESPGERELFRRLQAEPGTETWIVLHSLEIAKHVTQRQGEADFVVVIPNRGVVVIEVKAHQRVTRSADGVWQLGGQPPSRRSPFKQADRAKFSLLDYLDSQSIPTDAVPFASIVWFTSIRGERELRESIEWEAWQMLDRDDLDSSVSVPILAAISGERSRNRKSNSASNFRPESAAAMVKALRPKFDVAVKPEDLKTRRQAQLISLLDEQYDALDSVSENRSVVIVGPAGSGKTLLAKEFARRESIQGRSGWLLCFNRLLGIEIKTATAEFPGVVASSIHRLMLEIAELEMPTDPGADFWDRVLPDLALGAALGGEFEREFLVVDEAQDLLSETHLDLLDLLVVGGLAGGRVVFFGDFERQSIYGEGRGPAHLQMRLGGAATFRLGSNCRNLPRVGALVSQVARLRPGYRRFRRLDDGIDPRMYWYGSSAEQGRRLVQAIQDLRNEDFSLEEIVVLSVRRAGSVAMNTTDTWLRRVLVETRTPDPVIGRVRFSTVHSFKGLESPAVVLTDIDDFNTPNLADLLYVGITRATDRVSVLSDKSVLELLYFEGASNE